MTHTFTVAVTRRRGRYTVQVKRAAKGGRPIPGPVAAARAVRLRRAVQGALDALRLLPSSSVPSEPVHERRICPQQAASRRLDITAGDQTRRHYALHDRRAGAVVFVNSDTAIEFAGPRDQ